MRLGQFANISLFSMGYKKPFANISLFSMGYKKAILRT
jgi:hypothetical protein